MKKLTLVLFGLSFLVACNNGTTNNGSEATQQTYSIDGGSYRLCVVDGCDYLVSTSDKSMCHKGDCRNPIHTRYTPSDTQTIYEHYIVTMDTIRNK